MQTTMVSCWKLKKLKNESKKKRLEQALSVRDNLVLSPKSDPPESMGNCLIDPIQPTPRSIASLELARRPRLRPHSDAGAGRGLWEGQGALKTALIRFLKPLTFWFPVNVQWSCLRKPVRLVSAELGWTRKDSTISASSISILWTDARCGVIILILMILL